MEFYGVLIKGLLGFKRGVLAMAHIMSRDSTPILRMDIGCYVCTCMNIHVHICVCIHTKSSLVGCHRSLC